MKIIYHCFGGTHSSVTAAAFHLGMLPSDRTPRAEDLQAIPFFDTRDSRDHGNIALMGIDGQGNEIYFVGQRGSPQILENIIHGLARQFDIPPQDYKLVNVMYKVNLSMRLGGYMSRRFKWIYPGRPLVTWGTIHACRNIINLVRRVKAGEK
ncbi:Protein of unknown function (DUF3189) [Desulfoscipio gibsoniae DSM 7213]|uniref:DUF3189 domain-containing protein n=1 Tax=Desulfoscipio gibsoniae DSM 7213 TaxID=767817 RepID=R4KFI9_9FIRM|nr:Protein of unknown function (DUF3189) [Desulfoscipio gibsoniae DSM 7213]